MLVTKSRRFPLMIDPQNQANAWVRKMEESRQLKVFDPNSKERKAVFVDGRLPFACFFIHMFPKLCCLPNAGEDIMKSLERAIEFGAPVLLENVGEAPLLSYYGEPYAKEDACSHCIDGDMLHNQGAGPFTGANSGKEHHRQRWRNFVTEGAQLHK